MRGLVRPAQYVALALYILFLGFPLLWLMSASVKSSGELNSLSVSLLPSEWLPGGDELPVEPDALTPKQALEILYDLKRKLL